MQSVFNKSVSWLSIIIATTITVFPLSANAQVDSQSNCVMTPQAYISPNTLAMMAFRGAFEEEGIPGYIVFRTQFNSGSITAEKIVDAAVKGCVLSNRYEMGSNSAYIEDVNEQIQLFLRAQN